MGDCKDTKMQEAYSAGAGISTQMNNDDVQYNVETREGANEQPRANGFRN